MKRKRSNVSETPTVHSNANEGAITTRILQVARLHNVTRWGYKIRANPTGDVLSTISPQVALELSATLRYIAWHVPYAPQSCKSTKYRHFRSSYGLKHLVERTFPAGYVSNGSALLAYHLLDMKVANDGPNGSIACGAPLDKKAHALIANSKTKTSSVSKTPQTVQRMVGNCISCATNCSMPNPMIGIIFGYLDFTVNATSPPTFVVDALNLAAQIDRWREQQVAGEAACKG